MSSRFGGVGVKGRFLRAASVAVALAAGVAPVVVPVAARAQPSKADEAKDRFVKGVGLYKEGDFASALVEFKRSYELNPNYNVLNNIGQVYFQLKDYPNALRTLQQYLNEGGPRIPPQKRTDAEHDVETLKGRVATVGITVSQPGAEVFVDDVPVGVSPLKDPVLVSAGTRRFVVTKEGFNPARQSKEFAGGDRAEVALSMTQLQPGQVQPRIEPQPQPNPLQPNPLQPNPNPYPQPQPQPQPHGPSYVGPIVAWSVTGALAVVWGAMGGVALSASSDLNTLKQKVTTTGDLTTQANKTKLFAGLSDGFMAGTIVGAGVATALTIVVATSPRTQPAHIGLSLSPSFVGVNGSF